MKRALIAAAAAAAGPIDTQHFRSVVAPALALLCSFPLTDGEHRLSSTCWPTLLYKSATSSGVSSGRRAATSIEMRARRKKQDGFSPSPSLDLLSHFLLSSLSIPLHARQVSPPSPVVKREPPTRKPQRNRKPQTHNGPRRRLELAQQRPLERWAHLPRLRQPLGPGPQVRRQHVQAVLQGRGAEPGLRQVPLEFRRKGNFEGFRVT